MLEKTISSLLALRSSLWVASRLIAQTINQQLLAQKFTKKNEISELQLAWRQKVKKAQSKTLKVAEERATSWKCSKPTARLKKNGMITSIDGAAKTDPKGLYWILARSNGEMAPKGAAETTVKKGDKIELLSRSV